MTPKERANELVDNFRVVLMNEDTDCGNEILCTSIAINHAFICVDEIIKELNSVEHGESGKINGYFGQSYWLHVKQEIKKL